MRKWTLGTVMGLLTTAIGLMTLVNHSNAGGPLLVDSRGNPVIWAKGPVAGGPLNSVTVDQDGQVIYHVDSGNLGSIGHDQAVKLVDRIFRQYSTIETSTIRFANGGSIRDPGTGQPADVTAGNVGQLVSSTQPTYQNPIIFDSDGSITGGGGVLGFYSFNKLDTSGVQEAFVVLNGATIGAAGGVIPYLGVFTHEFGHFAGPLDHQQVNGRIAARDPSAALPGGFGAALLFDIFAPFTETLYPFVFRAPPGSLLAGRGFGSSGVFIATLDLDTRTALSNLYPASGYLSSDPSSRTGSIGGRILVRAQNFEAPVSGVNVVARRIGRGAFPPSPLGTQAFPGGQIPLDPDGVPLPPPDRDATDCLATAASVVSGLIGEDGSFQINGLPPGDYSVYAEGIHPSAVRGSSIGQFDPPIPISTPEYFNGANESNDPKSDDPKAIVPVAVRAAATAGNIDIMINGFGGAMPLLIEMEPNDAVRQAQLIPLQAQITGMASDKDPASVMLNLGPGLGSLPVHDLYRMRLTAGADVVISLRASVPNADIDLWLFSSSLKDGVNPANDPPLLLMSRSPSGHEFILTSLPAGDYYVGVSSFSAAVEYRLTVLNSKQFSATTASRWPADAREHPGDPRGWVVPVFDLILWLAAARLHSWSNV